MALSHKVFVGLRSAVDVACTLGDLVGIDSDSAQKIGPDIRSELVQFVLTQSFRLNESAQVDVAWSGKAFCLCSSTDAADDLGDGLAAIIEAA